MTTPVRFWSRAACAGAAGLALLLALPGPSPAQWKAHYGIIVLSDGFVLEGDIKQMTKLEFHGGQPIHFPSGFMLVDDGVRRFYFSPKQARIPEAKEKPQQELIRNKTRGGGLVFDAKNPPPSHPVLEVLEATDWEVKPEFLWERVITFRSEPRPVVKVPQRLMVLTPRYARLQAIWTRRYWEQKGYSRVLWYPNYLTQELGLGTVQKLLAAHPDLRETSDLKREEAARRRFKRYYFLAQAGWYDAAGKVLDGIVKDFKDLPDQKQLAEAERERFLAVRGRERLEEIKRLHQAGQYQAVQKLLKDFPDKGVTDQTKAELFEIKTQYKNATGKLKEADRYLKEAGRQVAGTDKELAAAAATIRGELEFTSLERLDTFLSQSAQAERQRKAGRTPARKPAELVSLAVTGWLLGNASAETKPESALRLWRARRLVLAYQRARDADGRQKLLTQYLEAKAPRAPLDELAQVIPNLPPPEPDKVLGTKPVEVKLGAGRRKTTYLMQLPPEYRHSRRYPVLLVLHRENEDPADMLKRWAPAAAANGYILAAPEWRDPGVESYNFTPEEHARVLDTLRDLRRKFQVDSDRVFLFGLSEGGTMAFDVGLAHPDRFAGVLPMSAAPEQYAARYWRNAQYLPFYVVNGSHSGGTMTRQLKELFLHWTQKGFPTLWVEYQGRGAEWFGGELQNMFDWMRSKRRAFPAQELGTYAQGSEQGKEFCAMRPGDNQFYWLKAELNERNCVEPGDWDERNRLVREARLAGRVDVSKNTIYVNGSGVKKATVWLVRNSKGETLVDLSRPVSVRFGLNAALRPQKVKPSLETLLDDLCQRGDREHLVLAKIEVPLR